MRGIQIPLLFVLLAFVMMGCKSTTDSSYQSLVSITSLTATPDTIAVGGLSTVVVTVIDPDGEPLSYSWSAYLGDIIPSANKNEVFYTASACCVGTNKVTVVVKDGKGGEVEKTVQVEVLP